jgi:predicted DNA-binding protein (MmcQ/YjbR family)
MSAKPTADMPRPGRHRIKATPKRKPTTRAATEASVLKRLGRICDGLPSVTETVTFGHPTFQANGKTFMVLETFKGDLSICVNVGKTLQGTFDSDPRFYRTPYIGKHGWISLKVHAAPLNWSEITSLVKQSHKLTTTPAKH